MLVRNSWLTNLKLERFKSVKGKTIIEEIGLPRNKIVDPRIGRMTSNNGRWAAWNKESVFGILIQGLHRQNQKSVNQESDMNGSKSVRV